LSFAEREKCAPEQVFSTPANAASHAAGTEFPQARKMGRKGGKIAAGYGIVLAIPCPGVRANCGPRAAEPQIPV